MNSIRWVVGCTLGLWILLVIPLTTVQYPELVDYPSHVVRHHLVSILPGHDVLDQFYEVRWRLIPNLAADGLMLALRPWLGVLAGSKVALAIGMLGWMVAPLVLYRVLWGEFALTPLASGLVVYNAMLYMGFENFYLTIPLVGFVLAAWVATESWPEPRRVGLLAVGAMLVWSGHLVAWGVLGLCITGWVATTAGGVRVQLRRLAAAWLAFVPGALLFVISQWLSPAEIGRETVWAGPGAQKLGVILAPTLQYEPVVDLIHTMVLLPSMFVLPFVFGTMEVHRRMGGVIVLLAAASVLMPTQLLGIYFMDQRVPCVLAAFMFAAARIRGPRWLYGILAGLVLLGVGLRVQALIPRWKAHDAMVTELMDVAGPVLRPGDRVLPGGRVPVEHFHVADPLIVQAPVFMPNLFTGAQLLGVTASMEAINHPAPTPVDRATLEEAAFGTGNYAPWGDAKDLEYLRDWPHHFDVLVWLEADDPPPLGYELTELAAGSWFTVYRIPHDRSSATIPGLP